MSSKLHRTPDRDKKYLRDNDRAFLAIKAFDLAIEILKSKLKSSVNLSAKQKKQVLLDSYEAYKHAQKMQISTQMTEHLLVRAYSQLQENTASSETGESVVESDNIILDRAIRCCQARTVDPAKKPSLTSVLLNIASGNITEHQEDKVSFPAEKQIVIPEQNAFMQNET